MRFTDINIDEIRDATVFLDVDGTLVADRGKVATPEVAALVKKLAEHNDVYLASNGGGARTPVLAQALGVNCLPVLRKPLSHSAIRSIERRARTVVIGDKLLTDGLFAYGLKAELILLTPLREGTEVPMVRLSYALDAVASALFHGVHAIRNSLPGQYVRLMRPKQWIKNLLLLTPLFFAGAFLNPELFIAALLGLISFSAAASAGYVVNDLLDREQDRFHPKKKNRPLASGRIGRMGAFLTTLILVAIAAYTAAHVPTIVPWIAIYIALTFSYSLWFKRVPILELMVVSFLYVLRILAGGAVIGVPLSGWIVLTTFFASLFVTAGKRYAESQHEDTRAVIRKYSPTFLATLPALGAMLTIICYALYSILGTPYPLVMYSTLFVAFGVLWYLHSIYAKETEHPDDKLWSDLTLLFTVAAWGFFLVWIYYGAIILTYLP